MRLAIIPITASLVFAAGCAQRQCPEPVAAPSPPPPPSAAAPTEEGTPPDPAAIKDAMPDKGPNVSPNAAASKGDDAVGVMTWAQAAADWGRRNKNPMAIAVAAQAVRELEVKALQAEKVASTGGPAAPASEAPAKKPLSTVPDDLFKEALALAVGAEKKAIEAMAKADVKTRGRIGGVMAAPGISYPGSESCVKVTMRGKELAIVGVVGDGDADLDLYVADSNGWKVCASNGPGYLEDCAWVPRWTDAYVVCVENAGEVASAFMILTN